MPAKQQVHKRRLSVEERTRNRKRSTAEDRARNRKRPTAEERARRMRIAVAATTCFIVAAVAFGINSLSMDVSRVEAAQLDAEASDVVEAAEGLDSSTDSQTIQEQSEALEDSVDQQVASTATEPDGEGWSTGSASAYSRETNDDGEGNFGVSTTASGIPLDNTTPTVAVPQSQRSLLRSMVEIFYRGKLVEAQVTDTGGFAKYGRVLDLSPAVWRAFGAISIYDWGVRTVWYRFL